MIFQHYRELVPKKEAEKFWQTMSDTAAKTVDGPALHQAPKARTRRRNAHPVKPAAASSALSPDSTA